MPIAQGMLREQLDRPSLNDEMLAHLQYGRKGWLMVHPLGGEGYSCVLGWLPLVSAPSSCGDCPDEQHIQRQAYMQWLHRSVCPGGGLLMLLSAEPACFSML